MMTVRWRETALAISTFAALAAACAEVDDAGEPEVPPEQHSPTEERKSAPAEELRALEADDSNGRPEPGELQGRIDQLLGGTQGAIAPAALPGLQPLPPSGAVEVVTPSGSCTGVMVGSSMVLTAAHCFKPGERGADPRSGYFNGKVQLARSGTTWTCLTSSGSTSNGKCSSDRSISYERYASADEPTHGSDFMVLFPGDHPAAWRGNVAHLSAPRLWGGLIGWDVLMYMSVFGRGRDSTGGTGAGVMRYSFHGVPLVGDDKGSFSVAASSSLRWCRGDSGGPLMAATSGYSDFGAIIGLLAAVTAPGSASCATTGKAMYAIKISPQKLAWINEKRRFNNYAECSSSWGEMYCH